MDWTESQVSEIDILPGRISSPFCGRRNHGGQNVHYRPNGPARRSRMKSRLTLIMGILALVAFVAPVRPEVALPGTQVLLSWPALAAGTTYAVQTSTNLSTWVTAASTMATSINMSMRGNSMCAYRLMANNLSSVQVTLAWSASIPPTILAGYYIYCGGTSRHYTNKIDAGLATTAVISNLQGGATYYFATTAYAYSGKESAFSSEAVWQAPPTQIPLLLQIQRLP